MKLSTKTRYAMRFMIDMARQYMLNPSVGRVALKDVAEREGISKKYLEQVVAPLVAADLVTVTRGNTGGYSLSRAPEKITLDEIFSASEGDSVVVECVKAPTACERSKACASREIWSGMNNAIRDYLSTRTLADVAKE